LPSRESSSVFPMTAPTRIFSLARVIEEVGEAVVDV
jgi:hypothetical protein